MTMPSAIPKKIEEILDANYKNRRATKSGNGIHVSARVGDPNTSVEAARKVNVTASVVRLLRAMRHDTEPCVVEEIVARSGVKENNGSTRFCQMRRDRLVCAVDAVVHKGRRKTRYLIGDAGIEWLRDNDHRYDQDGELYAG